MDVTCTVSWVHRDHNNGDESSLFDGLFGWSRQPGFPLCRFLWHLAVPDYNSVASLFPPEQDEETMVALKWLKNM